DKTSDYGNNIPPAVLDEQGWLYKQYFDAFRELKGKISAVTFWGMADDDTWLDSFPVARTDYPLPFDMQLQAKPAYWGIIDPTQLPGYGLTFSLTSSNASNQTRLITITVTNGNAGPAYTTQISGEISQRQSGVLDHLSIGVTNMEKAVTTLSQGDRLDNPHTPMQIGRDGKWQFNLYDPDGTRLELMEFSPVQKPCCSPFTAPNPSPTEK